jgi:hypothetical protein
MDASIYSKKLKDPRWQKKRLEVFERDKWTCQKCGMAKNTLTVHHRRYIPGREPWEYPDQLLVTLCEDCHESEWLNLKEQTESLVEQVQDKFFAEDIQSITGGFNALEIVCYDSRVIADVYAWALSNPDIQRELAERYFSQLKENIYGT